MKEKVPIEMEGRRLEVSNLDKVLYPATGFTKAQVIDYYDRVSPAMLPHLEGRPVTLKRYPDGVDGKFFYEKECPAHHPEWVHTAPVPSHGEREVVHYCVVENLSTLVWLANLAALELHTILSRYPDLIHPGFVVFDLDPGAPADILDCARAAHRLREILHDAGLECFPKTSGGKGLHVYAPLNTEVTFDRTKAFAHAIALLMEKRYPKRMVAVQSREERKGKVLVDWGQNDLHKSTACVYCLRARERPLVSTPLSWDELEELRKRDDPGALYFEPWEVLERIEERGDLFAPVLDMKQYLPDLEDAPTPPS